LVLVFATILYEMAIGYEMDSHLLDDLPNKCNPKVKKILERIFKSTTDDVSAINTLDELLNHPFFKEVELYSDWRTREIPMDGPTKQLVEKCNRKTSELLRAEPQDPRKKSKSITTTTNPKVNASNSANTTSKSISTSVPTNDFPLTGTSLSTVTPTTSTTQMSTASTKEPSKKKKKKSTSNVEQTNSNGAPPASDRTSLLSSIEGFNVKKLRKATTVDKSGPKL